MPLIGIVSTDEVELVKFRGKKSLVLKMNSSLDKEVNIGPHRLS